MGVTGPSASAVAGARASPRGPPAAGDRSIPPPKLATRAPDGGTARHHRHSGERGADTRAGALADGDPASDVLVQSQLFNPVDSGVSLATQARLEAVLAQAARAGFPIRVALIASQSRTSGPRRRCGDPDEVRAVPGFELPQLYGGQMLVVMPNGFGLYGTALGAARGHPAEARGAGDGARLRRSSSRAAALSAVPLLARAAGHPIPAIGARRCRPLGPTLGEKARVGTGLSPSVVIALVVGALLIAAAWTWSLRARPPQMGRRPSREAEGACSRCCSRSWLASPCPHWRRLTATQAATCCSTRTCSTARTPASRVKQELSLDRLLNATAPRARRCGSRSSRTRMTSAPSPPSGTSRQTYANYLGYELSLAYAGRLLIVMPGGLGVYWHANPAGATKLSTSLSSLKPASASPSRSGGGDSVSGRSS